MKITLDISLTDAEAKMLYDIMPNDVLKTFVLKRYIERKSMKQCEKEMAYTERHIYRISNEVKSYAMKILLERLVPSTVGVKA
jgi:hypothetical protein